MESSRGFEKNSSISFYLRKRRFILAFIVVVGLLLVAFRTHQTSGLVTRFVNGPVDEIYGFLHLVLNGSEDGLLSSELSLEGDNNVSRYNPKYSKAQWWKERTRINQEYPVIVFSKSYCPYSRRAKELLASYDLQPPPKIVEVDLREDDQEIKRFLIRLTDHSTFPNILVKGKSLGGSDNLANLHSTNQLRPLFLKAGAKPREAGL